MCPWEPATVTVTWLPITWAQTMVSASHWVGLTLPGMIDAPGSFSGRLSSPNPERGPEPSRRPSLAIFFRPEERRVGEEGVGACSSWLSPYRSKNKKHQQQHNKQ